MLKYILSVVFFWVLNFTPSQSPLNYHPKSLNKQIEKLWGIKEAQKEEIAISDSLIKRHRIKGKYFIITDKNNIGPKRYAYIGRVNSCRAGGCSISNEDPKDGAYEYFDYFILFNSNIDVELVKVFNYQATHGQEVTSRGWLKQFIGYNGTENLQVGKNIDAIAGATISVHAITFDVSHKTGLLGELQYLLTKR